MASMFDPMKIGMVVGNPSMRVFFGEGPSQCSHKAGASRNDVPVESCEEDVRG